MPSSKLREVTSGNTRIGASRRSVNVFAENPIVTGPRTSRPKKKLVEVDTSDEDLEDQEEDEVDDEDAPGEDDEDMDADGDLDMDDAPPQPPVPKRHAKSSGAPASTSKAMKGIEAKEMELDAEEEEGDEEGLSDPESDAEGEPDDQEESGVGNVNGGDEDLDEEEDEEDLDSDDGTPTADPARMTKRQRGTLGNDFLQLPMEPQVKKHLTAEERAMRRAEMARRRKNLSEKRNEEEKMDTINRLLRKQAPKRRGRIPAAEAAEAASAEQEMQEFERPEPTMARWVSGREGSRIIVCEEWLGSPAGRILGGPSLASNGPRKLVEEV
ncbi:PAPA-1-like conserved region-domain-containing protein [Aspergillus coremiiformis]|uniref:PAPA-1-like conserved region-domain-containing protein n=1 Tax=Aspergillus coremiiformis TaxID=138285 RepID=A0A5N6YW50_9EURO|nr:PAPA-1-like conserved region-domain-containing protein [Aspergillus coremiiformis]